MKLDPAARTAKLPGEELSFGHAVLATGANVRRLRVDGAELEGIHYLRALGNADAIRADAADAVARRARRRLVHRLRGRRVADLAGQVVHAGDAGGGAAVARASGARRASSSPACCATHGVEWVAGDALGRFEGDGRVQRVVTESGRSLDADLVVMGTGAVPDVMLARSAGPRAGRDGRHRLLVGAGDVGSRRVGGGRRVRVRLGGPRPPAADRALGGRARPGRRGGRGDHGLARAVRRGPVLLVGPGGLVHARVRRARRAWDEEVVRGSVEDGAFTIFYLDGGRVVAA